MTLENLLKLYERMEQTETIYRTSDPRDVGWRHSDLKAARFDYRDACVDYVNKLLMDKGLVK